MNYYNISKSYQLLNLLSFFAKEKANLRKQGKPIDDFELLIGATAVTHNCKLVTNNIKHFQRIPELDIEDWTTN